jgi:hypothetical protein
MAMWPVLGLSIFSIWLLYADRKLINVLWIIIMFALLKLLGFFDCWKPSEIKQFMKNAKRMGL